MNEITNNFGNLYEPKKALIIYEKQESNYQSTPYIESYDMDETGCPINGHPLTVKEANALAKSLLVAEKKQHNFLNPKGLLPKNVVFIKTGNSGYAVWQTPAQRKRLLFIESLGIQCGEAHIPPLLWKAGKNGIVIFALSDDYINTSTKLYHAPFFNVYPEGRICMGNVAVNIPNDCFLETFMDLWQEYFFNSYFSHLFGQHMPIKSNVVQLWQNLIGTDNPFPMDCLIANNISINQLIQ